MLRRESYRKRCEPSTATVTALSNPDAILTTLQPAESQAFLRRFENSRDFPIEGCWGRVAAMT